MISVAFKDKQLHVGDTVQVKTTVVEGTKTRIQTFEGIILSIRGRDLNKSFVVRRIGNRGIGVERTWPLDSTSIVDIEVVKSAKNVRRSKLYFLRNLIGRAATQI